MLHEYDGDNDNETTTANTTIDARATTTSLTDYHDSPTDTDTTTTAGFAGADTDRPCIYTRKWKQVCFLQELNGVFIMHAAPTTEPTRAMYAAPHTTTPPKQPAAVAAAAATNPANATIATDDATGDVTACAAPHARRHPDKVPWT